MSSLSRRNFLHAGGVAAAGAVVVASPISHASAASPAVTPGAPEAEVLVPEGVEQLVLHVKNPSTGEVSVLTDGAEVVFIDPTLVARVQRAAQRNAARRPASASTTHRVR